MAWWHELVPEGGGLEGAVTTNTKVREVTQTRRDEQIIKREGK
jgi:hypothetical protein